MLLQVLICEGKCHKTTCTLTQIEVIAGEKNTLKGN
jgi:hypothetical protein